MRNGSLTGVARTIPPPSGTFRNVLSSARSIPGACADLERRSHPCVRPGRTVILRSVAWVFLLGGCAPKYYAPNSHNVPLFQQQGEGAISFAAGESRVDLQGAYAVTHNVALMLNIASFNPKDDADGDGGKGGLLEVGLGYYRGLSRKVVFETYGLIGGGDVENHFPSTLRNYPSTTGKIESKLFRYGIQSALGFRSRYFDASISTRIARLIYSNVSGSLIFAGEDQVEYLRRQNRHLLVEPAVTLRTGYDFLKLQIQRGVSFNVTNSDFRQDKGHLTVGIGYHFGQ